MLNVTFGLILDYFTIRLLDSAKETHFLLCSLYFYLLLIHLPLFILVWLLLFINNLEVY